MIAQRIKLLRLARGWSLEALAAEMGGIVTKQALQKYEQAVVRPSPVMLAKIAAAFGVKVAYLFAEPAVRVEFIAYRSQAGLLVRERAIVESLVSTSLEDRIRLQELTGQPNGLDLPVRSLRVESLDDAERAAGEVRDRWRLGTDSIATVVDVFEDHHLHVIQIEASEKFDGISAVARDNADHVIAGAVVTRLGVPGERQRLNLTHELGHLVLDVHDGLGEERAAFRFGASFLAPASGVRQMVGAKRAHIQLEELLLLKRRFGLSVQAVVRRLRDLEIINDAHYKHWCIEVNRLGWKKIEPLELAPEQPKWLRFSVLHALAENVLSKEEAERLLGEPVDAKVPLTLVERRAFMKLPMEDRRRILAEQAAAMLAHYDEDKEWQELEAGDFIEY